ncbi:hypothetical protein OIV83_000338 [Microbotryomycetes sp. JL201]|nr:hypothetical protein OIV83_000338 [Microbotryomycetes sp. JL201]
MSSSQNPYLQIVQASFRTSPPPSAGYAARLILLGCFLGSILVSVIILLCLHWGAMRRKNDHPFVFKRVKREGGTFIVGSRTVLLALFGLNVAITLGLSLLCAHRFLDDFSNGVVGYNVCMFVFWSLTFVLCWAFTCSNLQAYLLARQRNWATARRANGFFIGFGLLFSLFLLGITVWGSVKLHRTYVSLVGNFRRVVAVAQQFNGVVDEAQLAFVKQRVDDVNNEADTYIRNSSSFYIAFSLVPIPIFFVNIAAMALVYTIRRQRRENQKLDSGSMSGLTESKLSSAGDGSGSHGRRRSSAKTITDRRLQTAEQALLLDAVATFIMCIAHCVANLWSAVMVRGMLTSSWSKLEATLLLPAWSAGIPVAIALILQIAVALHSRRNEMDNDAAMLEQSQAEVNVSLPRGSNSLPFTKTDV